MMIEKSMTGATYARLMTEGVLSQPLPAPGFGDTHEELMMHGKLPRHHLVNDGDDYTISWDEDLPPGMEQRLDAFIARVERDKF